MSRFCLAESVIEDMVGPDWRKRWLYWVKRTKEQVKGGRSALPPCGASSPTVASCRPLRGTGCASHASRRAAFPLAPGPFGNMLPQPCLLDIPWSVSHCRWGVGVFGAFSLSLPPSVRHLRSSFSGSRVRRLPGDPKPPELLSSPLTCAGVGSPGEKPGVWRVPPGAAEMFGAIEETLFRLLHARPSAMKPKASWRR